MDITNPLEMLTMDAIDSPPVQGAGAAPLAQLGQPSAGLNQLREGLQRRAGAPDYEIPENVWDARALSGAAAAAGQPTSNFWQSLAGAINQYNNSKLEQHLYQQRMAETRQQKAFDNLTKLEDKQSRNAARERLAMARPLKLKDGSWATWDPTTNPPSLKPLVGAESGIFDEVYAKFLKIATENKMPNPEDWATDQAWYYVRRRPVSGGEPATPAPGAPGSRETRSALAGSAPAAPSSSTPSSLAPAAQSAVAPSSPSPAAEAPRARLDWQGDPREAFRQAAALTDPADRAAMLRLAADRWPELAAELRGKAASPTQTKPASVEYLDQRKEKQEQSYGTAEGKDLVDEARALKSAYATNTTLQAQLTQLKHAFSSNKNIASGELAPFISTTKSYLEGIFGRNVVGDSPTWENIIDSLSTDMALHTRTKDGTNLLPGAISNYENQLMFKMVPQIKDTKNGRLAKIDLMMEFSKTNMRISEEATKFAKAHDNKLTPEWEERKQRVMREERARLAEFARELVQRYNTTGVK